MGTKILRDRQVIQLDGSDQIQLARTLYNLTKSDRLDELFSYRQESQSGKEEEVEEDYDKAE
jgi:hypothetical protein